MTDLMRQWVKNRLKANPGLDEQKLIDNIRNAQETDKTCTSCGKAFEAEEVNDREEGYFCDSCLESPH